jgi:uncharacterized protein (DUF1810 family)
LFDHFLEAQSLIYDEVLTELRNGFKETHWIWFIFPQLQGLGTSEMSIKFAIKDSSEALQYWHHPILGERLRECFEIVQHHTMKPRAIFSSIDYLKYKSSYQLFSPFMHST